MINQDQNIFKNKSVIANDQYNVKFNMIKANVEKGQVKDGSQDLI